MATPTAPPAPASRDSHRVPRFDGLRGLACLALLVTHVSFFGNLIGSYQQPPSNTALAILVTGFPVCLGVFFTLTGLFLYRSWARSTIAGTPRPQLTPYFTRRVLRMIPPYYALIVVTLLTLSLNQVTGWWYVVRPFVLMQNYDFVMQPGLQITWTVVTEMHYYLLLPLIAALSHLWARRGATPLQRARRLLAPIPFLLVAGVAWAAYIHTAAMGMYPKQYWWPIGNVGILGIGMTLAILSALTQVAPEHTPALFKAAARRPGLFWLGAFALYLFNCFLPFARHGYGDWMPMKAALLQQAPAMLFPVLIITPMIAPGTDLRWIDALLTNPPVRFIGRISYGVYLWHFAVTYYVLGSGSIFGNEPAPMLRDRWPWWSLVPAVAAGSIAIATISYYALERPIMNWGERRLAERSRVAAPVVEPAAPVQTAA